MDTQSTPNSLTREAPEVIQLIETVRFDHAITNDLMATLDLWRWPVPRTAFAVSERNFLYRVKRALEQEQRQSRSADRAELMALRKQRGDFFAIED